MTNAIITTPTANSITNAPLNQNPAAVYLMSLKSAKSRRVIIDSLNKIAALVGYKKIEMIDTASARRKQQDVTYLHVEWHKISFQDVIAIQSKLLETYSAASVNRMMSAVNGVLKAAWQLELITAEQYQRARNYKPAKGETLPVGRDIQQGELIALATYCKAEKSPAGARDAAIIGILYTCGLRRSELVALELADYDSSTSKLKVLHGKGNKQRPVYVKNGAAEALAAWLAIRGDAPGALFMPINKAGKVNAGKMTDQAIYNMLKNRAKQAGVKKFSPHDFRRTCAGDMLDRGVDIVTVQHILGHASPSTTSRYDRRPEKVKEDAASKLYFPF